MKELFKKKIPVTVNYKAISQLSFYKKKYKSDCKISENWGSRTFSLPFHLNLTKKQINYITNTLIDIIKKIRKI